MAVLDANDQNFDELVAGEYTAVEFYGDYCGACEMFAPIFEETAADMPFLNFVHINVSHNRETGKRFGIEFIPTLYYFRNGEPVFHTTGAGDKKEFQKSLAKLLYA